MEHKLQTLTNLATTVAAVLLSAVLIKVYFLQPAPRAAGAAGVGVASAAPVTVGTSLNGKLPGVDWAKNGHTLILAISTTCHFCKESEPFYRRLKQEVGQGVKMMAVLPQPVSEAQQYLNMAGVKVDQVKQLSLGTIGVAGTPTLLLVDAKGVVAKVWVGKLPDQDQEQVLAVLKKG
jgi:hypothetical protein